MPVPTEPTTYTFDMTGDNAVRYHDRRSTLTEGEPGYGINHTNENGQACGPALQFTDFVPPSNRGIDAWDIDRRTVRMVGEWLLLLKDKGIGS